MVIYGLSMESIGEHSDAVANFRKFNVVVGGVGVDVYFGGICCGVCGSVL